MDNLTNGIEYMNIGNHCIIKYEDFASNIIFSIKFKNFKKIYEYRFDDIDKIFKYLKYWKDHNDLSILIDLFNIHCEYIEKYLYLVNYLIIYSYNETFIYYESSLYNYLINIVKFIPENSNNISILRMNQLVGGDELIHINLKENYSKHPLFSICFSNYETYEYSGRELHIGNIIDYKKFYLLYKAFKNSLINKDIFTWIDIELSLKNK